MLRRSLGLSALTGIKAIDLTKTSPQQLLNDGQISLGKRPREESPTDDNTDMSKPANKKCLTETSVAVIKEEFEVANSGSILDTEINVHSCGGQKKHGPKKKKMKVMDDNKNSSDCNNDNDDSSNDVSNNNVNDSNNDKNPSVDNDNTSISKDVIEGKESNNNTVGDDVLSSIQKKTTVSDETKIEQDASSVEKKKTVPGKKKKESKNKGPSGGKKRVGKDVMGKMVTSNTPEQQSVETPVTDHQKELTLGERKWAELCLSQIRGHSAADIFLYPVPKTVPKYYDIIKNPMDLKTMADKIKSNAYKNKNEFLQDLDLIVTNCKTYNKPGSPVYKIGLEFAEYIKEFTNPSEVGKLSGGIGDSQQNSGKKSNTPGGKKRKRLLGGDYAWCLMAIETLKTHALALPFYEPVSRSIPNYHKVIKRPMDFTTMTRKFERGNYDSKEACVKEIRQIFANCKLFNTEGTQLYKDAAAMERVLEQLLGNTSSRRGVTTYSMPQDDYIYCTNMLYKLRIHDLAGPFTAPIDPGFKEYFKVVKKPIDLLSMGRKLHEGKYSSKGDFLKDIEQIFVNCKLFNKPGSELYDDGMKLEQYYLELFNNNEK